MAALNGSSLIFETLKPLEPYSELWQGYIKQAQSHVSNIPDLLRQGVFDLKSVVVLAGGLPVVLILLNVLSQVLIPKNPAHPPEVFHWLPIIGSAIEYGNDPIGFFTRCREKYGDIFTFTLLGRKMTVALGPRGNNFVTGGKLAHMNAEEAYTHLTTPCFGKDVVYDVPNAVFMEQKRFIKAGLSTDNFRAYMSMMEDEITRFLETDAAFRVYQFPDERDEWGQFHPLRTLGEITILTASRTLQGREVRASLDKTFAQRYSDLDGGFTPLNFLFPNLPLPSYKRRDRAQKAMSEFYVDLIRKRKESGVNEDENDVIAALMDQKYKNGEKLAEHQIAHIMIALLMAGQHTSASTGTWALLRIAENPEIGQALYKEQVENFGTGIEGQFRTMTYDEMRDLPILDAVIRETLRMHPPIHSIIRKVVSDTPVPPTLASSASSASASRKNDAYFVPKGYYAVSSPAVSQVDPLVWKEARKWDPKRWLEKDGVADRAGRTYDDADGERVDYGFGAVSKGTESPYQPFGAGRHRCIGEQFAYLQLGMVISTLIRNMELRLDIPFPPNNYHSMITLPQDPCNISYRRRIFN